MTTLASPAGYFRGLTYRHFHGVPLWTCYYATAVVYDVSRPLSTMDACVHTARKIPINIGFNGKPRLITT